MKIKTQGLLLVFVPFATTFLFCGTMLAAEIRAQIELSRQAEFRELMVELNALPYHFMLVGSALISWKMSHRDFDLKKSEQQCEQIEKIVSQLRRQALHLRKERKELNAGNLEKLADEAEKVLGEINRYRNNITDSERVPGSFNRHTFAVAMENSIDSMFSTIKTLSAQEYLQDTTARARYEKLFQAQIGLVFLSLSISFGLAFLAAYILSRKLVGKIRTVEDNFRRLEENRELLPALTGDDELSNLDRTFHEMACKLSQAEEEKRKGRLLFSARLRLPIDRLSSDLSLMLRGVLMEPNELGRTRLTAAISNLAKLNTLIDELLNINNLGVQSNLVLNMVPCRPDRIIEGAVQCVEVFAERENHKLIN
ncbi:MAG TPA: hypothetical protein PKZ32_19000, partial [Candidatus Melainabacteria bacterium]|nr:hypothetical protein [Candidatus Melainabacteria bacterium]